MHDETIVLLIVVSLALLSDYINGFHDTANAIATSVSTRAIDPKYAVWMSAFFNVCGALYSTGVAKTIGSDIVKSASLVNQKILAVALFGTIIWNLLTWYYGLPSSSSHALIGGVIGAVVVSKGFYALKIEGILRILMSLVISPLIALVTGYILMLIMLWLFGRFAPSVLNSRFRKAQLFSAALMSFSHGSNDAQKAMGIITLALLSGGFLSTFEVPIWVKLACATAMGMGTMAGGWRIIKTMGTKIFKMEPINGFAADLNSALVIFTATFLHLPVSTTHVVSGSIMGVGAAKRVSAVHWGVARQMLFAWCLTIPASALVSGITFKLISFITP